MRSRGQNIRAKRLRLESLESRNMLSGHGLVPSLPAGFELHASEAAHIATASALGRLDLQAINQVLSQACGAMHVATVLTTDLTEVGGAASGSIALLTLKQHGELVTKLNVSISAAEPDATLDIKIGGTVVGQVTTNPSGDASAVFSSNPKGGQMPFLVSPTAEDGSEVTIGTLTGQLTEHGLPTHEVSRLFAVLSDDAGGANGTVKVYERPVGDDNAIRMKVSVRGAAPDSDFDVTVGGSVVGQIHTDASGNAHVVFSSDPKGNQEAFLTAPTAVAGTQVSIGALSGELGALRGLPWRHP